MFAYCNNNPVNYVDLSGNRPQYFPVCVEDDYHYIHDQNDPSIASLPLGEGTIGRNGCGVVASYNAMLDMGRYVKFEEVYTWYVNHLSIFDGYGKYGVFIGTVASYFLENGFEVTILISNSSNDHLEYSQAADASIMLYRYETPSGKNGHYISYSWMGNQYMGRNTVGGTEMFASPWEYGTLDNRYFAYEILIFDNKE